MDKTIIIAEIGECFNGSLDTAVGLMTVAKEAGCDIAKFQTLDHENISDSDPEAAWFRKIALDPAKIRYLADQAIRIGIETLFTPENVKTAKWLLDAGFKDVKIASSCMSDMALAEFVSRNFDRVFMSTGMASLEEVEKAVDFLSGVKELYILHCVSEYPTGPLLEERGLTALSPKDARINMMKILMERFPAYRIGYSDHTSGILAPVAAVAAGAKVIEKHITLDRNTPVRNFKEGKEYLGTDHILSLEPAELREMVRQVREVEVMLGEQKWERSEGEKILKAFLRERFRGDR